MNPIAVLRNQFIEKISKMVFDTHLNEIEVAEISIGDSPIAIDNVNDDECIFTIDRIKVEDIGGMPIVSIEASSAFENTTLTLPEMGTDELAGLCDWMELYKENIKEYASQKGVSNEGDSEEVQMDLDYPNFTKVQVDAIEDYVYKYISSVFADWQDRDEVVDAILSDVITDIEECADWSDFGHDEICFGDIEIAVARVIKKRVMGDE